jgi:3-hydroxyisobutyrate dehydrogenase
MRTALLGTGIMGYGMAGALRRAGLDVTVWNRSREKAEPLADDGVVIADSVAEAVDGAEVVITMLFDAESVLEIAGELTGALGEDAVWLQSTTVGPEGIERIAAAASGANLVDAPVLGTKKPAADGQLTVLVSGPETLIKRAEPVLQAIGIKTVVAGDDLGAASALKLACNAWILSITAAAAQSIALARGFGLNPQLFLDAIAGAPADSPYAQLKGKAMIAGDFTSSFAVDGGRKDLGLIAAAAASHDVAPGLVAEVLAAYDRASTAGHGDDDLAAVIAGF